MTKIEDLLPDVLPEVPGCPDEIAERDLPLAAREFCRETFVWQQIVLEKDDLTHDDDEHEIADPFDGDILAITRVEIGGDPVKFDWPRRDLLKAEGVGDLVAWGALQPKLNERYVPDLLADYYIEALTDGAKFRLMRMMGVEWAQPEMAGVYQRAFQSHVAHARMEAARKHTSRPRRAKS
ncbi:MAG: hypothetical protein ACOCZ7_00195, partial [Armatimonadota bacterium]